MSTRQIEQHTEQGDDAGRLLATWLSVNAIFSSGCGLVLLVGAPVLNGPLGVATWPLVGLGVALLAFAGLLLWVLADPGRLVAGGRAAFVADLAWITGAAVLLVAAPSVLSTAGISVLVAVTAVVAVFAAAQALGLRGIRGRRATGTSRLTVGAQRVVAASPERVWAAIADVGDYARFTSTIAATEIVTGDGVGMVRMCTDQRGGRWSETCTLWDEGRGYRMTVNIDTYPLSYRVLLHELAQTWSLAPMGDRTRLTLTFDATLKLGVIGTLLGKLLGRRLRIEEILDAYERELVPDAA